MWTVNEVSKRTGVSIRTLQYYDKIGLLHPAQYTQAGYRLYDEKGLERLQQILLFRELAFSLKEIEEILQSPDFDREKVLDQQIEMLTMKKEHLENLITFAKCVDFALPLSPELASAPGGVVTGEMASLVNELTDRVVSLLP